MPNAPWFKFFAGDYMSSPFVQSLEPEQELWYLRLIIASAISSPRGCLPLANGKLWRLAKAPTEEHFEQKASPILAKFEKDEVAGMYRVPKVAAQQLVATAELTAKRSEAGKRGAVKRWQSAKKNDGNLASDPMANSKQNIADSDSDSDSEKTEGKKALRSTQLPKNFKSSEAHQILATELGVNLEVAVAAFRDFHLSKGSTYRDWDKALNTWLRNERKFTRGATAAIQSGFNSSKNLLMDNPATRALAQMEGD